MPRTAALLAVVLVGLLGCGRTYHFELEATVTSEADGTPIAGATIHRNMWGEKSDPKTEELILRTDAAGRASDSFAVTDAAFGAGKPMWLLRVSKEGYEPEIVEFKPRVAPTESRTRLEVPVKLRRKE
jgi:hypothetical protein